jgi:MATE family multidrug resistance protein
VDAPVHRKPPGLGELLALAWPVVLSRSTQAVIGFTDAAMVARLGEDALAATTTGAMNSFTLFILPMGIVFIVQSFAAQLTGAGDPVGARRYGWYGLVVAAVIGLVAGLVAPLSGPALSVFGYTPSVHALMADYLMIRLLSCGAVVGTEALGNWFGGLGHTRLPMVANVIAMVVNIGLNWVLIYGNLGAPEMGVAGAAWASTVSSFAAFAILLFAFLFGRHAPPRGTALGLRVAELFRMLRFGVPTGLNWFLEFMAFSFFVNVVVADLGTTVVAAVMTVVQINSVSFMPAFGLASGGAILVGQAIGAGRHDDVPLVVRRTAAAAAVWMGIAGLAYVFLPGPLMRIFESTEVPSEQLVAVGASVLAVSAAWQLFDAAGMTLSEALRAAGDTAWTLWARVVVAWILFVPLSWIVVRELDGGPVGAMFCLVFYLGALSIVLWFRFRSGAWRHIDLTGAPPVH